MSLLAEIAQVQADISHHTKVLDGLKKRLAVLSETLHSTTAAAPASARSFSTETLPTEILSEIFSRSIPAEPNAHRPDTAPILASVCRRWRSILLDTPAFWVPVGLVPRPAGSGFRHAANRMITFAQNAGKLPINLLLCADLSSNPLTNDDREYFLAVLRRHAGRIGVLRMEVLLEDLGALEGPLDGAEWERLEKLTIVLEDMADHEEELDDGSLGCFATAPKLRSVWLEILPPSAIKLPWSDLENFRGTYYTVSGAKHALRLAPNLISAYLSICPEEARVPADVRLVHPRLQKLELYEEWDDDETHESRAVDYFSFPVLQTLVIGGDSDTSLQSEQRSIGAFLAPMADSLQQLTLDKIWPSNSLPYLPLETMHSITELRITTPLRVTFAFDFFSEMGASGVFMRALRHLEMRIQETNKFTTTYSALGHVMPAAVRAVLWRNRDREGVAAIEVLKLVSTGYRDMVYRFEEEDVRVEGLRELKRRGVDVYVGTDTVRIV
ncbi:F-box domain-containing protein [Mycena kentingensis (nom. inval.)]|nr:F-box domain-containing protein [Mycena kentingensis (nom. inval.)]